MAPGTSQIWIALGLVPCLVPLGSTWRREAVKFRFEYQMRLVLALVPLGSAPGASQIWIALGLVPCLVPHGGEKL